VFDADGTDLNMFQVKVPSLRLLTEESRLSAVVDELQPLPGELVVRKQNPSIFFGTNLAPWLVQRQVDSLIVTGCTTSGCVRASVIDGMSYNFRCFVIEDCVGDRSFEAHRSNLFDMFQKYCDLCTLERALALLNGEVCDPLSPRTVASGRI
jgi:maleamate amidohydrolase